MRILFMGLNAFAKMNGIRQYFSSQPKDGEVASPEPSQNRKKIQKIVSNMESVMKSVRKKKSKKKRLKEEVSGDGDITDISNILSCSLNLLSPKKSPRKGRKKLDNSHANDSEAGTALNGLNGHSGECGDVGIVEDAPVKGEIEDQENMGKKNVFQVLMQAGKLMTSTPNPPPQERKRRFPEEFAQEDSAKVVKRAKKSPEIGENGTKVEGSEKKPKSRRKKLFEIEVETVEFPRKTKEKAQEETEAIENGKCAEEQPRKKTKSSRRKKLLELEVEAVVVQEASKGLKLLKKVPKEKKSGRKRRVIRDSSPENELPEEIPVNGRARRSKRTREVEVEEEVVEIEVESSQTRPRRSCRQKIVSYSIDMTFLDDSPEKLKASRKPREKPKTEVIDVDESPKKNVKLAPIFLKPQKVEVDPEVLKARQDFLMSGIPEKMRQLIDKQRAVEEEFELNQFPEISHVTQADNALPESLITWRSNKIDLSFFEEKDFPENLTSNRQISLINRNSDNPRSENPFPESDTLTDSQKSKILKQLKKDFDNFPTNRAYNFFRKRQECQNLDSSVQIIGDDLSGNLLFTDKYRPEATGDFLVNSAPAQELKTFLESFQSDSSRFNGTFESLNEDSCSNYGNSCCVVLSGPFGSGKSAAVAAVAAELNFNVLEINAGMKRTGKKLLQDLQEATQSHKVGRSEDTAQRFSLILVEDAEIAFEQDEGFISAIHQIVADSKRPVILTTSEPNCSHLEKFTAMNVIHFEPPRSDHISKWLTLMALAEGVQLPEADISNLYQFNGQDVRKTTMDLEFFARSGAGKDLNGAVTRAGLRNTSWDSLWSNSSKWLEAAGEEGKVEDFAEFYDFVANSEMVRSRTDDEDLSLSLVEGAMQMRGISLDGYDHFKKPRQIERR
uniref:AAA+ ATPase domain-containing protein n=1 Tax=Phlebotomus papatasi TaxID=29031 RepID=A0A1B0D921_PHLPP